MSLYATINNFIAENAIIFSVFIPIISGAIGAYVSYKITIKSDKRKEYNEYVKPLYITINDFYHNISNSNLSFLKINNKDANLALAKLPKSCDLKKRIKELEIFYEKNLDRWCTYTNGYMEMYISDDDLKKLKSKTEKILEIIKLK